MVAPKLLVVATSRVYLFIPAGSDTSFQSKVGVRSLVKALFNGDVNTGAGGSAVSTVKVNALLKKPNPSATDDLLATLQK